MNWFTLGHLLAALAGVVFVGLSIYGLVVSLSGKKEMDEMMNHARKVQAEMNEELDRLEKRS